MTGEVIDYTNYNFTEAMNISVVEFFNHAAFCKSRIMHRNAEYKKQLEEARRHRR